MATTVKALPPDPLNHDVPIVDERGRPTPAFTQQWLKSRNIALTVEGTAVAVEEVSNSLAADYYTKTEVDAFGVPFILSDGTHVKLPLEH